MASTTTSALVDCQSPMTCALSAARLRLAALLMLASLSVLPGCGDLVNVREVTRNMDKTRAYEESSQDPLALATLKSVAIMPFENMSNEKSFDSMLFAQKYANQLATRGTLRVVTAQQVMAALKDENRRVEAHNARVRTRRLLGVTAAQDRAKHKENGQPNAQGNPVEDDDKEWGFRDPMRVTADAVKLGRMLDVDAVMMGVVTDYSPYYRPRLAVTVRVITTGRGDAAANALTELTQWGVPVSSRGPQGLAWMRQQIFDTSDGATARETKAFANNHNTEDRPYDTEIYLREMDRFFDAVTASLSYSMMKRREAAAVEAERLARAEARKRRMEQEAAAARVRGLVDSGPALPNEDMVVNKNHSDNIDRSWRSDTYLQSHPEKANFSEPEPVEGAIVRQPGAAQ